ncbi:unnamed protein product [Blumeria hordei]|uniref:DDHD domain-containing protein n=1 Tax=Blumeria hordei TaxID=2867405 RepID=A0A383UYF3_BLUHO|nr:unnamed protein product [Blumeria hordei]
MSPVNHSYGDDCHLRSNLESSNPSIESEIPKLKAQFFYSSPLPLDDPLSTAPSTSGADANNTRNQPRPFSAVDNEALEESWRTLISMNKKLVGSKNSKNDSNPQLKPPAIGREKIATHESNDSSSRSIETQFSPSSTAKYTNSNTNVQDISKNNFTPEISNSPDLSNAREPILTIPRSDYSKEEYLNILEKKEKLDFQGGYKSNNTSISKDYEDEIYKYFLQKNPNVSATHQTKLPVKDKINNGAVHPLTQKTCTFQVKKQIENSYPSKVENAEHENFETRGNHDDQKSPSHLFSPTLTSNLPEKFNCEVFGVRISDLKSSNECSDPLPVNFQDSESPNQGLDIKAKPSFSYSNHAKSGTTGQPFAKLQSRQSIAHPRIDAMKQDDIEIEHQRRAQSVPNLSEHSRQNLEGTLNKKTEKTHLTERASEPKEQITEKHSLEVSVGISRLHLVQLPDLQMKPIYWSPVNDKATVIRGTWFYKHTMYPVEPTVANQLELGYRELQPWSQTWNDEIESALKIGAAGEEKIIHRLWPSEKTSKKYNEFSERKSSTTSLLVIEDLGEETAAEGNVDSDIRDPSSATSRNVLKKYLAAQVIYKDSRHAYILKPNVQPSAYYGRRPLQKISKGISVGIPVIRSFDWKTWDNLHPPRNSAMKIENIANTYDSNMSNSSMCPACKGQETQAQVTDLVLVIHGIGQKLSERVESFNFTHAVNEFRRSMNAELCNSSVKRFLRKDLGGMTVLPINWRSNLSFEDGGLMKDGNSNAEMDYCLSDITQDSLPAVRKMISDVMLDIPYYMSNHKPRMIQAVIQEANRVYKLWCKNNQNFEKIGRVHLIAHSLGSAMVLEILSKQPTNLHELNLSSNKINTDHLDFKTTNCFFVGSPAGFFLLLEQGRMCPRRGLYKPDAEYNNDKAVTAEAGTFGCMALDNIYNVMHYNDPIAYRLNCTVDREYAKSLKEARLPSISMGFFESMGKAMRSFTPGTNQSQGASIGQNPESSDITRLPSNMEMEVHDFSREETAEKKFNLLNDNGQIDWYMNSGRGPLEIQYLNMLGAHSSYWASPDFVRMVVIECGRKPGKNSAIPSMKAVKVGWVEKC